MPFFSGNFSTFASLKTSVETALVSSGWTLDGNGVLSKGGVFVRLTATTPQLLLETGTSSGPGPGPLPGAPINGVKILNFTGAPMVFPANYDLHVFSAPDEAYLIVNYNGDRYQQLSFGRSHIEQIGGTGAWMTGQFPASAAVNDSHFVRSYGGGTDAGFGWGDHGCGLFFESVNPTNTSCVHTGLDTTGWRFVGWAETNGTLGGAGDHMAGLLQALPSTFNQNTILLPVKVTQRRLSKGQTIVADLVNARLCRIDNHLPGEIVQYGSDRWKLYPFHRKDASQRNGVNPPTGANHSGTFGYAIRYTGP